MKKEWNESLILELFNEKATGFKALAQSFQSQGLSNTAVVPDDETGDPLFKLVFYKNSQPDLSALPEKIGDFKIVKEFRGINPAA